MYGGFPLYGGLFKRVSLYMQRFHDFFSRVPNDVCTLHINKEICYASVKFLSFYMITLHFPISKHFMNILVLVFHLFVNEIFLVNCKKRFILVASCKTMVLYEAAVKKNCKKGLILQCFTLGKIEL